MNAWGFGVVAMASGYLLGSVPSGYLIGRRHGIDVREFGSRNIGATNVLRTLGATPAALVFVMDVAKGAVPVGLALLLGADPWVQVAAGVGAIAGHTWPFALKFKGGRAVATSFGVVAVLSPLAALCAMVVFAVIVGITRYVSLGSITSCVVAAVLLPVFRAPLPVVAFGIAVAALIVYRHRPNIGRLLAGTESRIGQRVTVQSRPEEQRKV